MTTKTLVPLTVFVAEERRDFVRKAKAALRVTQAQVVSDALSFYEKYLKDCGVLE